jgi:hypothetical protein
MTPVSVTHYFIQDQPLTQRLVLNKIMSHTNLDSSVVYEFYYSIDTEGLSFGTNNHI